MLDFETVEAVERGVFHIYPVDTIDQGIEILTGRARRHDRGTGYDQFSGRQRLREMGEKIRAHPAPETRIVREDCRPCQAPPKPPGPPEPPR